MSSIATFDLSTHVSLLSGLTLVTVLAFLYPNSASWVGTLNEICIWSITGGLTAILLERWLLGGHIPLGNLYESCLALSGVVLGITLGLRGSPWARTLFLPTALMLNLFAANLTPMQISNARRSLVPALQSNWLTMHVSMMISSYGLLILGCICAIMWLSLQTVAPSDALQLDETVRSRCLSVRQRRLADQVDCWSYRLIMLGFPLLTLGIVSGAVWANETWGSYWSWDPKETWALLTWLVFAIYLHTRLTVPPYPINQSATMATIGLASVWMCYLGINGLGQGLHTYGWFQ